MSSFEIQMLFGWPAIILALGFALAGIFFKQWILSLAGAILFVLPGWYVGHYFGLSMILPLLIFGSAYAIYKNKILLAFLFIAPILVVIVWLGFFVLTQ